VSVIASKKEFPEGYIRFRALADLASDLDILFHDMGTASLENGTNCGQLPNAYLPFRFQLGNDQSLALSTDRAIS
jgi:hypothetical protein